MGVLSLRSMLAVLVIRSMLAVLILLLVVVLAVVSVGSMFAMSFMWAVAVTVTGRPVCRVSLEVFVARSVVCLMLTVVV